jgi:hypothetical protein
MSEILGGAGQSIVLETNGVANAIQTLLNLIAGGNITLTADGSGGVTITASVSNVPVITQSTQNSSASAANLSKAFTGGNVAGNSIIVIAQWANSSTVTMSVADSNLNSYASLRGPDSNGADGAGGSRSQVWLANNIVAGANTVTITPSANAKMMLIIIEVQNLAVLSAFDQSNWNDSLTPVGPLTSGPITTTQAVELLIAYGGTESQAAAISLGSGWQSIQNTSDGPNSQTFFAEYQVATNINTFTGTANISPNSTYGLGIISLRAAISATSPNAAIATFTTASLATNAMQAGTIALAKTFALLNVRVSQAARVRLYVNAAARTADAGRSNQTPPLPGTQSGIIADLYLDTSDKWVWQMTPAALGYNWDVTQNTAIYYTVTNLGNTGTVQVTFTYIPMES